jgi:hypothetical protein
MTRSLYQWCTLFVVAAAACGDPSVPAPASGQVDFGLSVQSLTVPAPVGSSQSQLTASATGAVLSWLDLGETGATLRFSERTATGWTEPRTVASGDDWFLSWADVPTVLRMRDGTLVANWYPSTDPLLEAYDLRLSYSRDDGQRWAAPFSPHHDGTTTQHGFATPFEMADGGLGVVWLDGRDMELNTTDPDGGSMAIYFASFGADWVQAAETRVDDRVCECCQTTVAMTADGVLTAFRDRSPREVRDIHVSRLASGGAWSQARPIHVDNFRIDACPINGPALSALDEQVAAAWFSAPDDDPHAFAAFSADSGLTWGEPIRLDDDASLGQVDVELLGDGTAIASWMEFTGGARQLRIRRVTAAGGRSDAVDVPGGDRVSGYPHMTRSGDELLFVWTGNEEGVEQLRAAVARPTGAVTR